jgi:hypothetical protein
VPGSWRYGWATGDTVPMAEMRKGVGAIFDSTLGAAAASFDVSLIAQSYAHLFLVLYARGDTALGLTSVAIRYNGDSTASYDSQYVLGQAATPLAGEGFAETNNWLGNMPAATAGANLFGSIDAFLPNYANSTGHKALLSSWAHKQGTSTTNLRVGEWAGFWRSTQPINRFSIFPNAGNFAAGSRLTVYAMGA